MNPSHRPLDPSAPVAAHDKLTRVLRLYGIESLATVGGTLMSIGIFFYMKDRFGWQLPDNFKLAAAQGVVYIPGALLAGPLTARFGPRKTLIGVYLALALLTAAAYATAAWGGTASATGVVAALLVYTFAIGISWPILEGLVASGGSPAGIARRLAVYNIIWPAGGALAVAVEGLILKYWPAGVFILPGICHIVSVALVLGSVAGWRRGNAAGEPAGYTGEEHRHGGENDPAIRSGSIGHPAPEPELLRKRKLALWISRTALPATYTVIYGLMPMMPSLPVMRHMPTTVQTVVASVWLMTRWVAFVVLALGSWWHTRPRALVWAAVVMLIAFFGMTFRPTHGASPTTDLVSMIAWQALLGLALGMIYAGSLYFGMVLSDGSTAHGGYHEALIGLGWILGPAAGAAAQAIYPDAVWIGVGAVGAVIAASVMVVLITAIVMGRSKSPVNP